MKEFLPPQPPAGPDPFSLWRTHPAPSLGLLLGRSSLFVPEGGGGGGVAAAAFSFRLWDPPMSKEASRGPPSLSAAAPAGEKQPPAGGTARSGLQGGRAQLRERRSRRRQGGRCGERAEGEGRLLSNPRRRFKKKDGRRAGRVANFLSWPRSCAIRRGGGALGAGTERVHLPPCGADRVIGGGFLWRKGTGAQPL